MPPIYPAQSRLRKAQGRKKGLGASRVGMTEAMKSRQSSIRASRLARSPCMSLRMSGNARYPSAVQQSPAEYMPFTLLGPYSSAALSFTANSMSRNARR